MPFSPFDKSFSRLFLPVSLSFLFGLFTLSLKAQIKTPKMQAEKPALVVGIVVDQMRYDYLYRYYEKYGKGGFKRLIKEGFNERNTQYPYIPTATGPGHACIFTGSVPALDGIIDNDWYSRKLKHSVYCVGDSTVESVGSNSPAGKMSPRNLLVTTITDQLKFSDNYKSKVIGISQKDRASILPVGHSADAAYWLDGESGHFISSTYYLKKLPDWVNSFNLKEPAQKYLSQDWNTLLPIDQYIESDLDEQSYEASLPGEASPVFPHRLSKIKRKDYDLIRSTPFGNDLTKDFALETIKNEKLGKSGYTDFLTLSFSSTDYVGHAFGPNSIEIEDTYLRLDKDLEEILKFLDQYLGKENIVVFLTADHGVAPNVGFNQKHNIPSGLINGGVFLKNLNEFTKAVFGNSDLIEKFSNDQIYLNLDFMEHSGLKEDLVFEKLKAYFIKQEGVSNLIDLNRMEHNNIISDQLDRFKNGYYTKRSGDFQLLLDPNWMFGRGQGTTHGSGYPYDSHVPLLWYGWKIKAGESTTQTSVCDISSTLAAWLRLEEPNGSLGKVLPIPLIN